MSNNQEMCDHTFSQYPFEDGPGVFKCKKCGKKTEDVDVAFPPVDEEGGDF